MSMGTLVQVAKAVGGELRGEDRPFDSVSTDTRTIGPGQLFFALRGERFDAGDFVADAAGKGATGAVVESFAEVDLSQVRVGDSRLALGALARDWRQHFDIPVIGITGSNGKTTVKELTAAIMRVANAAAGDDVVLATRGNLNNDIGVPLTLLNLRDYHLAAVVEMGANHPGDIAVLADIAAHNVAILTNAGRSHLEGFGSVEEVAQTKGEIVAALGASDVAVLNRDDRFFPEWAERAGDATVVSFGTSEEADYRAINVEFALLNEQPGFEFDMITPEGTVGIQLPLAGRHNVLNSLAAAAGAMAAGASLGDVVQGLASSSNVPGRLRSFRMASGATVYDDAYNANPESVSAAIAFLEGLDGEPWLVLGDMGDLGPDAAALHRGIGELARDAGMRGLLCIGEMSRQTAEGFGKGAQWFANLDELEAALLPHLGEGTNVLVKASRFMELDKLVKRLEANGGED